MNKEGWAPAVYLKRVGSATGNSPASLKRLTAMGMQLRDETKDVQEMLDTEGQGEGSSRKSTLEQLPQSPPPPPPQKKKKKNYNLLQRYARYHLSKIFLLIFDIFLEYS